jgi:hypothetical protein
MKKVYIIFNYDVNEVILATEDKEFAQECMCDCFMADVEYQWYWEQQYRSLENENIKQLAYDIWNDMIIWYNDYIGIIEEDLI